MPGAVRALFDQVPSSSRCCPTRASRSSSCTTTTSRPRCAAAVLGRGEPGVYNLAGEGEITMADLAHELGWYSVPVPELPSTRPPRSIARLPFLPDEPRWIEALRAPGAHGHGAGAQRAGLDAGARRRGDTARHGRREPRRPRSGHPARRVTGLLAAYRGTGADLPWGDPRPAHPGVRMEGYFWRFTDPDRGRVVIALCGVNRARDGFWSTLGLASDPNGFLRTVAHPEGWAARRRSARVRAARSRAHRTRSR